MIGSKHASLYELLIYVHYLYNYNNLYFVLAAVRTAIVSSIVSVGWGNTPPPFKPILLCSSQYTQLSSPAPMTHSVPL